MAFYRDNFDRDNVSASVRIGADDTEAVYVSIRNGKRDFSDFLNREDCIQLAILLLNAAQATEPNKTIEEEVGESVGV